MKTNNAGIYRIRNEVGTNNIMSFHKRLVSTEIGRQTCYADQPHWYLSFPKRGWNMHKLNNAWQMLGFHSIPSSLNRASTKRERLQRFGRRAQEIWKWLCKKMRVLKEEKIDLSGANTKPDIYAESVRSLPFSTAAGENLPALQWPTARPAVLHRVRFHVHFKINNYKKGYTR